MTAFAFQAPIAQGEAITLNIDEPIQTIICTLPIISDSKAICNDLTYLLSQVRNIARFHLVIDAQHLITHISFGDLERFCQKLKELDNNCSGMYHIVTTSKPLVFDRFKSGDYDLLIPWRVNKCVRNLDDAVQLITSRQN